MQLRATLRDDRAVSSVLGVVLMVAVTIILAAVVGTFVLGIGSDLTDGGPQTSWEVTDNVNDNGSSSVVVLHGGGDNVDRSTIEVTIGGQVAYRNGAERNGFNVTEPWNDPVTSGDRLRIVDDSGQIASGDMVIVFWRTEDASTILKEHRID